MALRKPELAGDATPSRERYFGRAPAPVSQGGPDGRAFDGDDSYPRQPGGPATAGPAQGPAPPVNLGTYATPPSTADILSDPVMSAQLQRAWLESNPNAPDVPRGTAGSLKQEQGGWFLWRRDSHILQIIRVAPGTRDGLATIVGTRPPDSDIQLVVGWFHTHPNKASEGYGSAAGVGDISWQNAEAKVPGIIMTHTGTVTIPYP